MARKRKHPRSHEGEQSHDEHHYCVAAAQREEDLHILRACEKVREYLKKTPSLFSQHSEETDVASQDGRQDGADLGLSDIESWTTAGWSQLGRTVKEEAKRWL